MVGNLTSVTTAPATTSAPSVSDAAERTGKNVALSGGTLPPAPAMPVVDVSRAVERLNELMSGKQRSLRFQVDEGSGRTVITVINESTKEVIRQIPSEELLAIAQNLEALGSLIDAMI